MAQNWHAYSVEDSSLFKEDRFPKEWPYRNKADLNPGGGGLVGGTCLSHQPPQHTSPLHKMFNRNTVKLVAVSCPPPPQREKHIPVPAQLESFPAGQRSLGATAMQLQNKKRFPCHGILPNDPCHLSSRYLYHKR